jgi:hypothetical protein
MTTRRPVHGLGHRIGNWCSWIIWAMFLIGVPILGAASSVHPNH